MCVLPSVGSVFVASVCLPLRLESSTPNHPVSNLPSMSSQRRSQARDQEREWKKGEEENWSTLHRRRSTRSTLLFLLRLHVLNWSPLRFWASWEALVVCVSFNLVALRSVSANRQDEHADQHQEPEPDERAGARHGAGRDEELLAHGIQGKNQQFNY